jgi:hypothetical protein
MKNFAAGFKPEIHHSAPRGECETVAVHKATNGIIFYGRRFEAHDDVKTSFAKLHENIIHPSRIAGTVRESERARQTIKKVRKNHLSENFCNCFPFRKAQQSERKSFGECAVSELCAP